MITLLHGDNIEASRAELVRLKDAAGNKELRAVDGKGVDAAILTQALESSSLFGGDTVVVVERLFEKIGKKTKLIGELCRIITNAATTTDVILWEPKSVGATVIKQLGKATVREFKTPVVIFQFLDGLKPGNTHALLTLYETLMASQAAELVFAMIAKRMRQLLQIAGGDTPEGMQGWQVSRLTTQAKSFTMDKLLVLYKRLLLTEYSVKSGQSALGLADLTRQWIMEV